MHTTEYVPIIRTSEITDQIVRDYESVVLDRQSVCEQAIQVYFQNRQHELPVGMGNHLAELVRLLDDWGTIEFIAGWERSYCGFHDWNTAEPNRLLTPQESYGTAV